MLTQSEGELVEALQFGHQGADCVPGLLLQSEVARVLDGLKASNTDVSLQEGFKNKTPSHLLYPLVLKAICHIMREIYPFHIKVITV